MKSLVMNYCKLNFTIEQLGTKLNIYTQFPKQSVSYTTATIKKKNYHDGFTHKKWCCKNKLS